MSAFNSRFVSLIDGANYMEPTFSVAYGNSLPVINEDISRIEVVYGPSSVSMDRMLITVYSISLQNTQENRKE